MLHGFAAPDQATHLSSSKALRVLERVGEDSSGAAWPPGRRCMGRSLLAVRPDPRRSLLRRPRRGAAGRRRPQREAAAAARPCLCLCRIPSPGAAPASGSVSSAVTSDGSAS